MLKANGIFELNQSRHNLINYEGVINAPSFCIYACGFRIGGSYVFKAAVLFWEGTVTLR
ncbi:hypothetical protein [Niallia circulans]|uniref:hypothetical protein n=1 Tax=Niallia circulans TaxID=1397 RepID=UPI000A8A8A11|nr:hypothetical protein [Niallia circulans]